MLPLVILWVNGIAFIGFGVACFFDPTITAKLVGYGLNNADSVIEVRAMYGGVQTILGVFMVLGACSAAYKEAALLFVALVYSGLVIGRLYGLLMLATVTETMTETSIGSVAEEILTSPTIYTFSAASFEGFMACAGWLCFVFLRPEARLIQSD
ncbi:MAG: DUF4345 domain-containing protein [Pseudomonadales bacterium]|nr:DUF4345 domain-containing protein [Pseudomonadales bacterium]